MSLLADIKSNEGFRGMPYDDTEGFPTIGFGTKLPIDEEEGELLLTHRLTKIKDELFNALPWLFDKPPEVQDILLDMAYNMGVPRLLGFKKTLLHVQNDDYKHASEEMLSSRWAKQVPNRAKRLSEKMREVV